MLPAPPRYLSVSCCAEHRLQGSGTYSAGVLAIDRLSRNPLADNGTIGVAVSALDPFMS
jgi:hypothetical protein